jgi:hypothetical protein
MRKEFLKMAGVDNEKDFYKLFPTEAAFFGMYPEAKKLVQKKQNSLRKAQEGLNGFGEEFDSPQMSNFKPTLYNPSQLGLFDRNNPYLRQGIFKGNFGLEGQRNSFDLSGNYDFGNKAFGYNIGATLGTRRGGKYNFGIQHTNEGQSQRSMMMDDNNPRYGKSTTLNAGWEGNTRRDGKGTKIKISGSYSMGDRQYGGLIKMQYAGGFCTKGSGCDNSSTIDDRIRNRRVKEEKQKTEFEGLEEYLPSDFKDKNDIARFITAANKRYQTIKDPKNNAIRADGSYAGAKGSSENFYNLMRQLENSKIYDPNNLSKFQEWAQNQGNIKKRINTDYYKGFSIPTPAKEYSNDELMNIFKSYEVRNPQLPGGINYENFEKFPDEPKQVPQYFQEGGGNEPLPQHQKMYEEELAKKIKWYEGRANHENPEIANEAKIVLEQLKQYPKTLDIVKYTPYAELHQLGVLGRYNPSKNQLLLSDPNKPIFPENIPFLNRPYMNSLRNDPKTVNQMFEGRKLAEGNYVPRHEIQHYLDKPALDVISKHNKEIYKGYVSPGDYSKLYKQDYKPQSSRESLPSYYWATGSGGVKGQFGPVYSRLQNAEMKRSLDDARNLYGIDPSKDSTPEDWKNILEKSKQKLFDKKISEEERLQHMHILDMFRTEGNDPAKMSELNNLIVKKENKNLRTSQFGGGQELPQYQTKGQVNEQPWWMKRPSDISQRGNQNLNTEIATQRTKEKKAEASRNRYTIGEDKRTDAQKQKDVEEFQRRKKVQEDWYGKDFNTPQYIQDKNRARADHLLDLLEIGTGGAGLLEGALQLRKFIPRKKVVMELEPPSGKASWDDAIDEYYDDPNYSPDYTDDEFEQSMRTAFKQIEDDERKKRLSNQARNIISNTEFNPDLTPLDDFYTSSDWKTFANDPSMKDLMDVYGVDINNQEEVEKFRKMFKDNYNNMFMNEVNKNRFNTGDAYLHNIFYNKNKYGGGIDISKKHFFNRDNFGKLVVGATRPNLKKAQFGLGNLNPLLGLDWTKRWLKTAQEQQKNPPSAIRSVLDPTGYSNYGNLLTAIEEIPKSKGVLNTAKNVGLGALEFAASLPMIGGAVAPIKGIKALRKAPALEKALVKGHNALTKVQPIAGIDKRLYSPLYKTAASGVYGFASPVGRGTRFWKGVDGALGSTESTQENPQTISIKQPDGTVKKLRVDSEEYYNLIQSDAIDPNSFNTIDSSFSLRKKK